MHSTETKLLYVLYRSTPKFSTNPPPSHLVQEDLLRRANVRIARRMRHDSFVHEEHMPLAPVDIGLGPQCRQGLEDGAAGEGNGERTLRSDRSLVRGVNPVHEARGGGRSVRELQHLGLHLRAIVVCWRECEDGVEEGKMKRTGNDGIRHLIERFSRKM